MTRPNSEYIYTPSFRYVYLRDEKMGLICCSFQRLDIVIPTGILYTLSEKRCGDVTNARAGHFTLLFPPKNTSLQTKFKKTHDYVLSHV